MESDVPMGVRQGTYMETQPEGLSRATEGVYRNCVYELQAATGHIPWQAGQPHAQNNNIECGHPPGLEETKSVRLGLTRTFFTEQNRQRRSLGRP